MTPQVLLTKANELSKPSLDTTDQALLELLCKEDKDNMEVPDADVSFVNSIVSIFQSLLAKKKPACKNRNTAGLNEIRIWWLVKKAKPLTNTKTERLSLYLKI